MTQPRFAAVLSILLCAVSVGMVRADELRELQAAAIEKGTSSAAHWGWRPEHYMLWGTHTNRLIPVYSYGTRDQGSGIDLRSYVGANSVYRSERDLIRLYDRVPEATLNAEADYMDQTNVYDLQMAGLERGKKHIFLVVFDGLDWQTTRAAAIHNTGRVGYDSGRGSGTHFQDYTAGGTSQFGFMVTSPHSDARPVDVNQQVILGPGSGPRGGYDPTQAGAAPWESPLMPKYLAARPTEPTADEKSDEPNEAAEPNEVTGPTEPAEPAEPTEPVELRPVHAYTDSASSATSMTAGIKTYNNAILIDPEGRQVVSIAHRAQLAGLAVGVVTSVPISHATPASAYAHNVHRSDYQDLSRDLLGQRSISHPEQPLAGLDVVVGAGHGVAREQDNAQGENFVPGNAYLAETDLAEVDVCNGGRYVVAKRSPGQDGRTVLMDAAARAARERRRLLGFFGVGGISKGHLPFATADGGYDPVPGRTKVAERYEEADLQENPTLAEMVEAALQVLSIDEQGFWLMVEAGDVDWANHDNNLDNAVGAVRSGDDAVKVITDWVEQHSNWDESLMILTGDHGHYLVLTDPEALVQDAESTD